MSDKPLPSCHFFNHCVDISLLAITRVAFLEVFMICNRLESVASLLMSNTFTAACSSNMPLCLVIRSSFLYTQYVLMCGTDPYLIMDVTSAGNVEIVLLLPLLLKVSCVVVMEFVLQLVWRTKVVSVGFYRVVLQTTVCLCAFKV